MLRFVISALFISALVAQAQAQVTVVESRPTAQAATISGSVAPDANQQADLFYRLQALQQEVLELRGLVEEQSYELNRLKQQRHDDYMDLDRRLASLSGGVVAGQTRQQGGSSAGSDTSEAAGAGEEAAYKGAYGKLRQRDLAGAAKGFTGYLDLYPKGQYAANSQYWLGEIYLAEGKLEQSKSWFERVIKEFPSDRKAPDAKYKLGTVLFQLGDKAKAKTLLQAVANSSADAARLAKDFLAQNY
ncbi:tol-pal system protein YbgF [Simiduia litorea]